MPRKFTTDPIETLEEWNAVLTKGCCCGMPECPLPSIDCQTKTGSYDQYLYLPFRQTRWRGRGPDSASLQGPGGEMERVVADRMGVAVSGVGREPDSRE
jgi:hypothetical protein